VLSGWRNNGFFFGANNASAVWRAVVDCPLSRSDGGFDKKVLHVKVLLTSEKNTEAAWRNA
jgi:hypothetical protein